MASVTCPERVYTFDVQFPLMVVGTAERHIQIFNLSNPSTPYKVRHWPIILTLLCSRLLSRYNPR